MNTKLRQFFIFFIGLGVSIGLDQFTKHLAVVHLKGQKPFVLIKGVFEFYYSENRGAAFGMLQGRQGFFFLIAAAVILAVLWAVYRMPAGKRYLPLMCSLFLLVSGAVGNMIDRLAYGYVVDFLYAKFINFPIFNFADCCVVIGAALLLVAFLFVYKEDTVPPAKEEALPAEDGDISREQEDVTQDEDRRDDGSAGDGGQPA